MKKILITTLLFLMSITTINAKYEVVSTNDALVEVNAINVATNEKSVEGFVARMYRLVLGREPEKSGFNYWVNRLKTKEIDGAGAVIGFYESKELINKNLSDEDYLKLLYKSVMNRDYDAGGLKYWKNIMSEQVTRRYILKGFIESKEFKNICAYYNINSGTIELEAYRDMNLNVTKFVNRLYKNVLERKAEVNGLEYWAKALLRDGKTGAELVKSFFDSKEFKNKNLTNEKLIRLMYKTILDREPDAGGLKYWMNKMNSGTVAEDILVGFVSSVEFNNLCNKYGIETGELQTTAEIKLAEEEAKLKAETIPATAEGVYSYLVNKLGYTKAEACGILANIWQESKFNPTAGSYYYGLCQWGGGRRSNLSTWCTDNGYDPASVKGQLEFMDYELKTFYPNTYQKLKAVPNNASGAGDAATIFVRGYEGASHTSGRYEKAIEYFNQF